MGQSLLDQALDSARQCWLPGNIRAAICRTRGKTRGVQASSPIALCTGQTQALFALSPLVTSYNIPSASIQTHLVITMSQIPPTASTSSTTFEAIFTAALKSYNKKTKKDIASHPLAAQLQSCDSSSAILAVLRAQVQANDQAQSADEKWTKWLDPTVNVVSAFSPVLNVAGQVITSR